MSTLQEQPAMTPDLPAPELPRAEPASLGLDPQRVDRIRAAFQREVDEHRIPGAVVLVAREGKVVYEGALGFRDREAGAPMRADDVFRIASMTKPVTIVAALMLAEEGRLLLPDPVARYLPEFARVKVGIETAGGGDLKLVEPGQPLTVQDLMRHTCGLTYGFFGKGRVKTMYNEAGVFSLDNSNEQMSHKLAELPLCYQPGSTWDYGMGTDVVGRLVEVLSGQSLGEFFRERIFAPLGMHDTGFAVPHAAGRLAEPQADITTGQRPPMWNPLVAERWQSGGAGLSSTAQDYFRFAQMLLNGGELNGVRLLAPSSVTLMASDHLVPGTRFDPGTLPLLGGEAPMPSMGQSMGLGVAVRTTAGINPLPGSVGNYYWGGALGTYFWIDPSNKLVAIKLTQAPADRLRYRYLIQQLVYQALLR